MGISNIISNKPPLFHYTRPDKIMKILSSKSLLARPTWDFDDADEYVHGLGLITALLKRLRASRLETNAMPPPMREVVATYGMNIGRVVERTIAHMEYEIANRSKPRVEVYVACTSTNGTSEQMVRKYGGFIIRFNWMLPVLGYACPRPFKASMLSWVTYDTCDFERQIISQGFIFGETAYRPLVDRLLAPMGVTEREASTAATAAIFLCVFAANIKKPNYAYEGEWRLKTVKVTHSTPTIFSEDDDSIELRRRFGMSEAAAFSVDPPGRYILDLRCRGEMIIENVDVFMPPDVLKSYDASELAAVIRQMREYINGPGFMGPAIQFRDELLRNTNHFSASCGSSFTKP